jgi:hypothetical protein
MKHGASAYRRGRCSCDICKADNTARHAREQQARYERGLPPDDPRHGTDNAYRNWGCRCDACAEAGAIANARSYARRTP